MRSKKDKWHTFDSVLSEVWKMLHCGIDRFTDSFHWPILGTINSEGCAMRTVILRQFSETERTLACYTDSRAEKVQEIRRDNRVSWLFYHPKKLIQLRLSGEAKLHSDDAFADKLWAKTGITTRLNFCAEQGPGTPIDQPASGLPNFMLKTLPTLTQSERGRDHFMIINCQFDVMDWVLLRPTGNRRARFQWQGDAVKTNWLIP